LHHHTEFQ